MKNKKMYVGAGPVSTQKGITLIALIITIIVMLILVAVTINMAINGGLFEKAGQAVGETQNAVDKDQELANGQITVDGKIYNSIDDYLAENSLAVHNWTRIGDTFTCSHCNKTYGMGQVVNYTSAGKTSTTITAAKSGLDKYYAKEGEYPTDANVDENGAQIIEAQATNWVILGIEDTDGNGTYETLLITTESPVKITSASQVGVTKDKKLSLLEVSSQVGVLYFNGATAYNNGPEEINRICKELYSNNEYGEARGITIEDVNNCFNYTPYGGLYFNKGWLTTGNLTTKLKDVPVFSSLIANGTYTPDGVNTEDALGKYELNGYRYRVNDNRTGLVNYVDNKTSPVTAVEIYTIFGASKNYHYYLSSRGISSDNQKDCFDFGLGAVFYGNVILDSSQYNSLGEEMWAWSFLRPVVSLRSKLPTPVLSST